MKLQSLFVIAAVSAVGCTSSEIGPLVELGFTRSGGLSGSTTSLKIDSEGHTTRTREDRTTDELTLSAETMADLRAKVDAAHFPSLDDQYDSNTADAFVYVVSPRFENASFEVASTDFSDAPAALLELNAALYVVASQ